MYIYLAVKAHATWVYAKTFVLIALIFILTQIEINKHVYINVTML